MCTSFSAFKKTCILHSAAYRCGLQHLLIKTHRKTHARRCNTHWNYTQMNSWKLNSGTESKPGLRLARATQNFGWSCSSVISLAKEVAVRDAGVSISRHRAQLSHPPAVSGIAHTDVHFFLSIFPFSSTTCIHPPFPSRTTPASTPGSLRTHSPP